MGAFLSCIVVHLTLPLMPLIIEWVLTQDISAQTLTIAVAMYAVAIGSSSKVKFLFYAMMGASILFSAAYGYMLFHSHAGQNTLGPEDLAVVLRLKRYSYWVIGSIFAIHTIERFRRHVLADEPFGV